MSTVQEAAKNVTKLKAVLPGVCDTGFFKDFGCSDACDKNDLKRNNKKILRAVDQRANLPLGYRHVFGELLSHDDERLDSSLKSFCEEIFGPTNASRIKTEPEETISSPA